jgi:hypothetical protein
LVKNELFSFFVFLNPHALGHTKSVTVFYYKRFGSTSPSAWCGLYTLCWGIVIPKSHELKMVTDFGYPRACIFIKTLNQNRLWLLLTLPTFFKTWFKFRNIAKKFQTSFDYFNVFQVVEHIRGILAIRIQSKMTLFLFLPISATFYEVKSRFEKSW